jgi:hypothetical protein
MSAIRERLRESVGESDADRARGCEQSAFLEENRNRRRSEGTARIEVGKTLDRLMQGLMGGSEADIAVSIHPLEQMGEFIHPNDFPFFQCI